MLLAGACGAGGGDAEASAVDSGTFIATYADLRRAALEAGGGAIEAADRERILEEHGVTEDALLQFAEVHGDDPAFMMAIWDEVELRLSTEEPEGPSDAGDEPAADSGPSERSAPTDSAPRS